MVRLLIFMAAVALVLLILALISALAADRVRNMPRALWILVILLIPVAGPLAYFVWGRPVTRQPKRSSRRPSAPDDDPDFLRSVDNEQSRRDREFLDKWERELKKDDEQQP